MKRQESAILQQLPAGHRSRIRRLDGDGRRSGRIAVAELTKLLRALPEDEPRERSGDHDRRDTDERGRRRKPRARDQRDPQWREDDAADARAVVGFRERDRPAPLVPTRDHRIDRHGTHRDPAAAACECRDKELPRRGGRCPSDDACRGDAGSRDDGRRHAEAPVRAGQVDDDDRTEQEVQRHRRGHRDQRPPGALDHRIEEYRRAVETHAPAEDREDERGPHHVSTEEGSRLCRCGGHRGALHACQRSRDA